MWCAVDALTSGLFRAVFSEVEVPEAEGAGVTQNSNPGIFDAGIWRFHQNPIWIDDLMIVSIAQ